MDLVQLSYNVSLMNGLLTSLFQLTFAVVSAFGPPRFWTCGCFKLRPAHKKFKFYILAAISKMSKTILACRMDSLQPLFNFVLPKFRPLDPKSFGVVGVQS